MTEPIFQVDAFAGEPFAGNPAAVCLLKVHRDPVWMQKVAEEMNLSETAFVVPGRKGFDLRWFTPEVEVELCGHATLAAAHVLWEEGLLEPTAEARFDTRSGLLTARREGGWIEMDFPADPPLEGGVPPEVLQALGGPFAWSGTTRLYHFVELESAQALRGIRPDLGLLRGHCPVGLVVTAPSDRPEFDFLSRFFGPAVGVDEDPVTGSAHCCLAPYWSSRLGRDELTAFQASPRGGVVRVAVAGERVLLSGRAVTVFRGSLSEAASARAAP